MVSRAVMALTSKKKKKSRKRKAKEPADPGDPPYLVRHVRAEFDSHADTCAFIKEHCLVIGETGDSIWLEDFTKGLGL